MTSGRVRVVVVGQTPPPFGGQAIAIQVFLDGAYDAIDLVHVRMSFSRTMGEVGQAGLRKVLMLPVLVLRILWTRYRTGAQVLYYPPTPSERVPFVRDAVILMGCRWAFRWTVFHFHSGGAADAYGRLGRLARAVFRRAYFGPDLVVVPARSALTDARFVEARAEAVVPNGVLDAAADRPKPARGEPRVPVVLFVGVLRESKGVLDLLDACAALHRAQVPFELRLVGDCQPPQFRQVVDRRIDEHGLGDRVVQCGPLSGDAKWAEFAGADLFCFPTFFEHENFPLVLLEAMQFGLPVVSTHWRGIDEIVVDGETGYLLDIHDTAAVADRLRALLDDPSRRAAMGRAARARYEAEFTASAFRGRLEAAIAGLSAG